ncbi:MAG: uracil phosphoribosyltransferase [Anaerolineae bacterium]|nr:uracil phosphoribosyltransferase [Anaerolineae bacterium]MDW8070014.1 uracil phosphoribosyltransferase [Anaerolineae bacterium]
MDNVFCCHPPLVRHKLTTLRDVATEPKRFHELIREISMLPAYEATADLALEPTEVQTPLGRAPEALLRERIGLVPILYAGLGMVDGIWEMMPGAKVWHIGLYRDEQILRSVQYSNKLPVDPTVQVRLVLDPMLAKKGSAVAAVDIPKRWGAQRIRFTGFIAAPEGLRALQHARPDFPVHVAAIDSHLNAHGYIVLGLGDAGGRQFGTG